MKLCTATRSGLSGQIRSGVTPGTVARPAARRSSSTRSCSGPGTVQHRRQRPAGLRERGDTQHVRGARLVPVRSGRPRRAVQVDLRDGPAAGQVRSGGVEPVAAPDQRSGSEGRVELVPGERDVVDPGRGEVDAAVRGELRGVDGDPRAGRVGDRGDPPQRQHLAGDVGRPGDGEQCRRGGAQRRLQRGEGLLDCARRGQRPVRSVGARQRQQVRVVLDVEAQHGPRDGGGQQVQRVGGVAGEHHDVRRAGPDELADALAGPLQQRGADLREVARAAVHARQQRQDVGDVRGDRLQGRRAGREVEVGVLGACRR